MLGVVVGLALFLLITSVVSQALVTLFWATTAGNQSYREYFAKAFAFELPIGMLSVNLGLAALIPVAWGLMAAIHQMKPRWLSSVQPRLRWRYLFGSLAIAVVVLNGVMLLSTTVGKPLSINPQEGFWAFLAVIVLTSPLQAAAEEIFFRGYLLQALGSLVSRAWFGVVVSSVVFALLHGTQNLPLFADRLIFGLLAGLLVWRTGGLEAAIAAHVINNVFAYLYAGLTTSSGHYQGGEGTRLGRRCVRRRRFRPLRGAGVPALAADETANPRVPQRSGESGLTFPLALNGFGAETRLTVKFVLVPGPVRPALQQAQWGIG